MESITQINTHARARGSSKVKYDGIPVQEYEAYLHGENNFNWCLLFNLTGSLWVKFPRPSLYLHNDNYTCEVEIAAIQPVSDLSQMQTKYRQFYLS